MEETFEVTLYYGDPGPDEVTPTAEASDVKTWIESGLAGVATTRLGLAVPKAIDVQRLN